MFIIVNVGGGSRPTRCTGPFASVELAQAWLAKNGYERAAKPDWLDSKFESYGIPDYRGILVNGNVWIRELCDPERNFPY
jgi:hypothetical protein